MSKYFFQDKIADLDLLKDLSANFDTVKKEILDHMGNPNILRNYPLYNVNGKPIYEKFWKACPCTGFDNAHIKGIGNNLEYINYVQNKFQTNCPITFSLIKPYEEKGYVANVFASKLLPGSIINPHDGFARKYLRVHLGLITDPDCKITVGPEQRESMAWEEGKFIAFNENDIHSVHHKGSKERIILSFDILYDFLSVFLSKKEKIND